MRKILSCIVLSTAACCAQASDGVYEINPACAATGGCFTGDAAGYPVTISTPGSYRLTGNLSTSSANTTLIEITTDNVSIDLNGFALTGPITCSGGTLTCSTLGNGVGIDAGLHKHIRISNGTIRGMGLDGVVVGQSAAIENLTVAENGRDGIFAPGPGSVVRFISAKENGRDGVSLGFGTSYLMDSAIYNNGRYGMFGGYCGNSASIGNDSGDACTAIAPNRCSTPTDCD